MVTQHIYWWILIFCLSTLFVLIPLLRNLEAFQEGVDNILDHKLMVDADRVIATNDLSIPTGEFISVDKTPFDFLKPHKLSDRWNETPTICPGRYLREDFNWLAVNTIPGCYGYNHGFVLRPAGRSPPITLSSERSGIKWVPFILNWVFLCIVRHRLSIKTNQEAAVVYTAWWLNAPRKAVHGGPSKRYLNSSAVAIEQQGLIDAINTPIWNDNQICK